MSMQSIHKHKRVRIAYKVLENSFFRKYKMPFENLPEIAKNAKLALQSSADDNANK